MKSIAAIVEALNYDGASWENNFVFGESFKDNDIISASWNRGGSFSRVDDTSMYRSESWTLEHDAYELSIRRV